jgi:hypothetical protein
MSTGTAGGQGNAIMQKRGLVPLCEQFGMESGMTWMPAERICQSDAFDLEAEMHACLSRAVDFTVN